MPEHTSVSVSTEPEEGVVEGVNEDRPEWLPEKFKSPEDLANAYSELQKRMSSGGSADEDDKGDVLSLDGDDDTSDDDADPLSLEKPEGTDEKTVPQVDLDKAAQEFAKNGELSDKTYADLEKAGLSRENANRYIRGLKAEADSMRARVAEVVGGEDALPQVMEWARDNLTDGEKALYESARSSGDEDGMAMAMRGIYAKYVDANGKPAKLLDTATSKRKGTVQPFESRDEMIEAMQDKRYRASESYRSNVMKRLQASSF